MSANDEWEYECSPDETESLYFTLDLTTHVPDALNNPPPSGSERTSKNLSAPRSDPTRPSPNGYSDSDSTSEDEEEDLPKLQILDLHTRNPLIKFEQSVYSCYWTTDLGTQVHIAQAGETTSPIRKGTVLDVIGISRARCLGRPVQLIDRNAPPPSSAIKASTPATAIDVDQEYDDNEEPMVLTTGPLKIPRSNLRTATSRSQASFLERLSEIKARKGERDQVPIIPVKSYTAPANAEALKRKAEDDDRNSALVLIDGRKRMRRRPLGRGPLAGNAGRKARGQIAGMLGIDFEKDREEEGEGVEVGRNGAGVSMFGGEDLGYAEGIRDRFGHYRHLQLPSGEGEGGAVPEAARRADNNSESPFDLDQVGPSQEGTTRETPYPNQMPTAEAAADQGYLMYQPRDEYENAYRDDRTPSPALEPERPPWLAAAEPVGDEKQPEESAG